MKTYESVLDLVRDLSEHRLTRDPSFVRKQQIRLPTVKLPHHEYGVHRCKGCCQIWNSGIMRCGTCGSTEFLDEHL